jgi:bifunctional UDP-N-acetylglucosamine pyrophosphorylase/glucosamine-1-phosphate N-acetyltransferase
VTIADPATTWIDATVRIGEDTEVLPGCFLSGDTAIGADCVVGPFARLKDAILEDGAEVAESTVVESRIGEGAHVGPFSYVRPGSDIGAHCRIGDFVEVKNSTIGPYTNAAHLAYIGDADVGDNVNYGCGSITVNYDGTTKSRTRIGSGAFIGSNSNLVAPVRIAENAYIAAGSTITADVPEYTLAIARARQENKDGWVLRKGRVRRKKG